MEVRLFRRVHGIVRVPVVREHHRPRLTQPLIGHHVPGQGVMELHRHIGGFHPEGAVVVLRTGDTPRNRSVGTRPGPQPAGVPIRPRPSVQRAVKSVQIETGTDRQTVGRGLGPVTGAEHDLPRGTASRGAQRRVDIGPQPTQVPRSDPPRGFAHLRAVEPALDGRPAPPVGVRGPHQRTVGVHRTHALPRTVAVLVMEPEQVPDLVRERPLRGVQAPRKGMCPPGRVVRSDDVVSEVGAADELQLHVQRIPVGEAQAATVVVGVHAVLGPLRQLVDLSVPCLGQNRVGLRVCHQMDLHHQPGEHLAVVRPTVPLDVVAPDAQCGGGSHVPAPRRHRPQDLGARDHVPRDRLHLGDRRLRLVRSGDLGDRRGGLRLRLARSGDLRDRRGDLRLRFVRGGDLRDRLHLGHRRERVVVRHPLHGLRACLRVCLRPIVSQLGYRVRLRLTGVGIGSKRIARTVQFLLRR